MLEKLTVLGTGTIVPVPGRKCAGYLLDTGNELLLIDCGPGILGQLTDLEIDFSRLNNIVLSHFHYDHISDLFALILSMNMRFEGEKIVNITAPTGIVDIIINAKKFLFQHEKGFNPERIKIREIEEGQYEVAGLSVKTARTFHTGESLCYRFIDSCGKSFFYSGDTGVNENIIHLGKNADLAVVECSHSDNFPDSSGHMTLSGVLDFYDRAYPAKLVLSHFYSDFLEDRTGQSTVINRSIILARDKDIFCF